MQMYFPNKQTNNATLRGAAQAPG